MSGFDTKMSEVDENGKLRNGAKDIYRELLGDQMEYFQGIFGYERRIRVTSRQIGMTNRLEYFIKNTNALSSID